MDKLTKSQRSYNMSQIKGKNTKPEIIVFKMLKNGGYKFKKHYDIPGKPDIVFPGYKLVIFIDGEFWHGKKFIEWKDGLSAFWVKKIADNIKRDKNNAKLLKKEGWHLLRLWGRDVIKNPDKVYSRIKRFIAKNSDLSNR